MAFHDDNDLLRGGVLPTNPMDGTQPMNAPPTEPQKPISPVERLRTDGLTLPEFLKLEFPHVRWIVEGLIQENSTHCFFGPPNGGKTFLAIDAMMRALEGGRRVLFYEAEGSGQDLQMRLRRALAAHQIEHPEHLLVLHGAEIDLTQPEGIAAVLAHAQGHKPGLIVFDSLAAMAGAVEENESAATKGLANTLDRFRTETGAAVLVLHHMTKEGWRPDETPSLRTLRGHSALAGRLDVAIAVIPIDGETTELEVVFDLYEVKQRAQAKLKHRRCRIAMPKAGEVAKLEIAEVDDQALRRKEQDRRLDQLEHQMLEAVPEQGAGKEGVTTAELRRLVSGANDLKTKALRHLLENGRLVRLPNRLLVRPTHRKEPEK